MKGKNQDELVCQSFFFSVRAVARSRVDRLVTEPVGLASGLKVGGLKLNGNWDWTRTTWVR